MDVQNLLIQAVLVAIVIAIMRAIITRVPGPLGRLGAFL